VNITSRNLIHLSQCRIAEDHDSGDLLFRSQMHVDEQDEVAPAAQQQKRRNLDALVFCDCLCVTISVAATRIYREDAPRITASRNRLGLSLSKRIRQGLVTKINGKMRSWTCEALGRILPNYSRAHRAPAPIASPGEARRASVFPPFSSPLHTYKCIESNPPYKYASLYLH
jgi:hypothetical protein